MTTKDRAEQIAKQLMSKGHYQVVETDNTAANFPAKALSYLMKNESALCNELFNSLEDNETTIVGVHKPCKKYEIAGVKLPRFMLEKSIYDAIPVGEVDKRRWVNDTSFLIGGKEYVMTNQWQGHESEETKNHRINDFAFLVYEFFQCRYFVNFSNSAIELCCLSRNKKIESNNNDSLPLQQIFYGAPGTGKSHKVKEVIETLPKSDVFRTTFHPDSDYSTFVGCYKPKMVKAPIRDSSGHEITSACEDEKKRIAYEYEPQAFLKSYVRAYETNEPVFLVIEEINRGNCAQIFGDMFQLLDRNENGESDYAIKPETAIQEFLNEKLEDCVIADEAIKSGEEMRLPANLHIWATMNTSDQSLFPIDSAFKRRWDWKYMPICQGRDKETGSLLNWAIEVGNNKYDWWSFVSKINKEIDDVTHSEDKKLGFFFCKAKDNVISAEVFVGKVIFYLWNDVFKDYGFDREIFKDEEGKLTFDKFYTVDASGNVVVVNSKMQKFLDNLGVDFFEDEEDDNLEEGDISLNEESSNTKNRFVLDGGEPVSLNKIVQNVVLNYATNHPTITAEEIRDVFLAAYKGSGIAHIIETEDEFQSRSNQKSAQRTVSKTVLPNGDTIYVSTQFRAKNPDDNFFKFIEITRKNGWGNIEKEKLKYQV